MDRATYRAAASLASLGLVSVAPDQVADLVEHALEEAPGDARFARLVLRGQRSLSLVLQGRLRDGLAQLESHARLGDAFAAAEQLLVLHVLGEDERGLRIPGPEDLAWLSADALLPANGVEATSRVNRVSIHSHAESGPWAGGSVWSGCDP